MKRTHLFILGFSLTVVLFGFFLVRSSPAATLGPDADGGYLPTPRPYEVCDRCEPNNDFDDACGPLEPGTDYKFPSRCPAASDDDLYYIDLERPGWIRADLTDIPPGTDYSLYLYYDVNQDPVAASDNRGNRPEHIDYWAVLTGRYYVDVYPWEGCSDTALYSLAVAYPTAMPPPTPTPTPTLPCNVHIDNLGDTDPKNDLRLPSGWELDPPGCGDLEIEYTGSTLKLHHDLPSASCTARYTTGLSLDASAYAMLAVELQGDDLGDLRKVAFGLVDGQGRGKRLKVEDWANQIVVGDWQGVGIPLPAFGTTVDLSQLETLSIELTGRAGAGSDTLELDRLRLERPLAPLTVDNWNDLVHPNALGGWPATYVGDGSSIETAYATDGTYDRSRGSLEISYTIPSTADLWALWETDLLGLDASDYDDLVFYIKGAQGGEKVNVYLKDGADRQAFVDLETYSPVGQAWTLVRIPLAAFSGVDLTDLARLKLVFEWEPMAGTVWIDDLRFVAATLLVDNFCDGDWNNSLNGRSGLFTSRPSCSASIASDLKDGTLQLTYDVTAGPDCYAGYWSRALVDLNPYRTLTLRVRGERCGQGAAASARTVSIQTDKLKLGDFMPEGITDQWQTARIPLAASPMVTDWTRGDSYVIASESWRGATEGETWWDDVSFETERADLWVENFDDEDYLNALAGESRLFWEGSTQITSRTSLIHGYGDVGSGLVLTYSVPANRFAGWETDLRSLDLSEYEFLTFRMKGARGGERPNIYLMDATGKRRFVNIETYRELSTRWQSYLIPLDDFGDLDLTRVTRLQVIIEWHTQAASGTLFLDDIYFPAERDMFLPVVFNRDSRPVFAANADSGGSPELSSACPFCDFECGTEGWRTYRSEDHSRAVIAVQQSHVRSFSGQASLALTVDLDGSDGPLRNRGVAYKDLAEPLNLACKPFWIWVYVPTCGQGDPTEPNSVRLFVRDENGRYAYSAHTPVVRNQWFQVRMRPSTQAEPGGSLDGGFDPRAITRFGVHFWAGTTASAYRGRIYLDDCGWREIDPVAAAGGGTCGVVDDAVGVRQPNRR